MPYIRLRHATRYFISTTITKLHDRSRHLTRSPNYPNPTNPVKQNTQISREKRSQTTFGLRMHRIEPHVEGEPAAASTEVDQSVATNQSDLEEDIQSNDGPHVAMVLNSVMRASSTLLETTRGVVHSSSVSGAETGIELEPYGFRALTHQVGDQSRLREGISTAPTSLGTAMIAPTLHSRCSTPPGARKEKGETGKTSEHARHGYKTTTRHIDIFTRWFESFQKFWNKHISVRVPGRAARDHLGESIYFFVYLLISSLMKVYIPMKSLFFSFFFAESTFVLPFSIGYLQRLYTTEG